MPNQMYINPEVFKEDSNKVYVVSRYEEYDPNIVGREPEDWFDYNDDESNLIITSNALKAFRYFEEDENYNILVHAFDVPKDYKEDMLSDMRPKITWEAYEIITVPYNSYGYDFYELFHDSGKHPDLDDKYIVSIHYENENNAFLYLLDDSIEEEIIDKAISMENEKVLNGDEEKVLVTVWKMSENNFEEFFDEFDTEKWYKTNDKIFEKLKKFDSLTFMLDYDVDHFEVNDIRYAYSNVRFLVW